MTSGQPQPHRFMRMLRHAGERISFSGMAFDAFRCLALGGLFFAILLQMPLEDRTAVAVFFLGASALLSLRTYHQACANHELLHDRFLLHIGHMHLTAGMLDAMACLGMLLFQPTLALHLWLVARAVEVAGYLLAPRLARLDLGEECLFPPYVLIGFIPLVMAVGHGSDGRVATERFLLPPIGAAAGALGFLLVAAVYRHHARQGRARGYARFGTPLTLRLAGMGLLGFGDAWGGVPFHAGMASALAGLFFLYHGPVMQPFRERQDRILRLHGENRARDCREEEFRSALRASFFGCDPGGMLFTGADGYLKALGYLDEPRVMDLERWGTYIHPEDRAACLAELAACLAESRSFHRIYRVRAAAGGWCQTRTIIQPLSWDAGGRPVFSAGLHADVSWDLRIGQDERREARRQAAFFEALPWSAFVKDREGRFLHINPHFVARRRAEHWAGRFDYELFTEHSVAELRAQAEETLENGAHVVEQRIRQMDGTTLCGKILLFPVHDGEEAFIAGVELDEARAGVFTVGTEGGRSEYDIIFSALNDGLFDVLFKNWTMTEIHYSPSWYTMLGYRDRELAESYEAWRSLVHPDDVAAAERRLWESIRAGMPYDSEYRMRRRDGTWCWIHARGTFIAHDPEAAAGRIVGTHTDISDRKRMEEELHQSEKMQAIGQLAGGIAHDFNNQLAAILGYGEMLLNLPGQPPEVARCARVIVTSAMHSSDLTKKLLAFSRKGKSVSTVVDMHEVIRGVHAILERSIDKAIDIRLEFGATPATVMGDAGLLQNAVLNLGLNARDAISGSGSVTFRTAIHTITRQDPLAVQLDLGPGEYLRLDAADTGCGMEAEIQRHLFEPFFTTKPEGKGTGMGLAAVYGTVKEHQGGIVAESRAGLGTTFSLFLPLYREHLTLPTGEVPECIVTGSGHILIIEDEPLVLELLRDFCVGFGYDVTTADSGDEGLRFFGSNPALFDLVMLDLNMPGKNGYDTFVALRALRPNVQILILSGYTAEERIGKMLDMGAYAHVSKPVARATLSRFIARAIAHEPPEAP